MKRKRPPGRRFFRRVGGFFQGLLRPRNAWPCVGLVVLGGCLTFIITPDEPGNAGPDGTPRDGNFPTVILDPGHGGRDEGTRWRGIAERDLTLDLANRVERLAHIAGFQTVMTRRSNIYVPLEERARLANSYKDALFVSLHFNSDPTTVSSGIETYYAQEKEVPVADWSWIGFFNRGEKVVDDTSETLAGAVQTSLIIRTEARNRGVHAKNFYVVHHTRCPAVLVEGGFISNAFESQLLSTEQYRETLAQGIAEGLMRYMQTRGREVVKPPVVALQRP